MASVKHLGNYPSNPSSPISERVRGVYVTGGAPGREVGGTGGRESVRDIGLDPPTDNGWRYAAVNDEGRVVGEHHHRAKLKDADIELIHELRDAGLSYGQIAAKFDDEPKVTKQMVWLICTGRKRSHTVMGHKRVHRQPEFTPAGLDEFDFMPVGLSVRDIIGGF